MEYIEIPIESLSKYSDYLKSKIKSSLNESMEREDMLKLFIIANKIINIVSINNERKSLLPILDEVYCTLRKVNDSLNEYSNSFTFDKSKSYLEFKGAIERNEMYLKSLLDDIKNIKPKINSQKFATHKLNISLFKEQPQTVESTFNSMVQFKDEVFYIKTNGIFEFFYFYQTKEGVWYWSPPKKTDPNDIWIQSPKVKITEGYWTNKLIPSHVEDFIQWLDIFKPIAPVIPVIPKEEVVKVYTNDDEGKKEKLLDDISKFQKNNKNCLIF